MENSLPDNRYINRELSWLAFNERVLAEAANQAVPLLERLRFLAITASNLDEFYVVRVAGLLHQKEHGATERSLDGLSAGEQLAALQRRVLAFVAAQEKVVRELRRALKKAAIHVVAKADLRGDDRAVLKDYGDNTLLPELTAHVIAPEGELPFVDSHNLNLMLRLKQAKTGKKMLGMVSVPTHMVRFVVLPASEGHTRLIPLENVLQMCVAQLFEGYEIVDQMLFRVVRDSWLEVTEGADDLVASFRSALAKRRQGSVVRLQVLAGDRHVAMVEWLQKQMQIDEGQLGYYRSFLAMAGLMEIAALDRADLAFQPNHIRFPERIDDFGGDCLAAIAAKDILVHHPYESFDVVVQFIRQAAQDEYTTAIYQTLYRTSSNSPIIGALIEAAEAGKAVTAVVELKARFDEAANLRWGEKLEAAGVRVIYGMAGRKTHCKISLIERDVNGRRERYVHFGTGNYHTVNATIYADLSYFTCDTDLCQDAMHIFEHLAGETDEETLLAGLKQLKISPFMVKKTLLEQIENEIALAQEGRPAHVWIKVNSLGDAELIDALYRASQAGVEVDLVVRGICCLKPGVVGLSENIRVKSIVGRFLEHTRIFCFGNGHPLPSDQAKLYISSADWMPRNMHKRMELMVPISNPTVHEQILDQVMMANLRDMRQSWQMNSAGEYQRASTKRDDFSAHQFFMENPSLSGRGSALRKQISSKIKHEESGAEHRIAVIDIGSNSVRLVIYDGLKRRPYPLYNEKILCGLAEDLDSTGKLNVAGAKLALENLIRFARILEAQNIHSVFAFATSAVRDAEDGQAFVDRVHQLCHLEIRIVSGREEARLAALGVASASYEAEGVVGDLGGGSLELAEISMMAAVKMSASIPLEMSRQESFPIGTLRLRDRYEYSVSKAQVEIDAALESFGLDGSLQGKAFYAVGGGFRALAKIALARRDHPVRIIEQMAVPAESMLSLLDMLIAAKPEELLKHEIVRGIAAKRIPTLALTALILRRIIDIGKPDKIVFSNHGVREGLLFDQLDSKVQMQDALKAGVCDMMYLLSPNMGAEWITLGAELYDWNGPLFRDETHHMSRLRYAACVFSNIAWHEHTNYRAESSFNWVLDSELTAIDHWERMFIAACVYHRYSTNAGEEIEQKILGLLDAKWYKRARMIGLSLRFGYQLCGGSQGILPRTSLKAGRKNLTLKVPVDDQLLVNEIVLRRMEKLAQSLKLAVKVAAG